MNLSDGMTRTNGKSEMDPAQLDVEHELPASDETGDEPSSAAVETERRPAGADVELQKLKAERDALIDRLARLQAEFENARKRAAREQQDFRDFALGDALKTLLPVLDSFERALQAGQETKSEFRNGVELIYKQLQDALAKMGLQPIAARGQMFDPRLHEAIEMVDTTEAKDHEVLEELQRGYKLKERMLRPAMVKVARNSKH
jgi:molecular chaperone GrpE